MRRVLSAASLAVGPRRALAIEADSFGFLKLVVDDSSRVGCRIILLTKPSCDLRHSKEPYIKIRRFALAGCAENMNLPVLRYDRLRREQGCYQLKEGV